jgi:hypothetical protein
MFCEAESKPGFVNLAKKFDECFSLLSQQQEAEQEFLSAMDSMLMLLESSENEKTKHKNNEKEKKHDY